MKKSFLHEAYITSNAEKKHEKVIFEITPEHIIVGFSGSPKPLELIPLGCRSIHLPQFNEEEFSVSIKQEPLFELPLVWSYKHDIPGILHSILLSVYEKTLLLDSRSVKVIVVESNLPRPIKSILSQVFLQRLMVPAITFLPSSVMSLLTLGLMSGITIEIGTQESTITPVYDGRHLETCTYSSSVGENMVIRNLKSELKIHGFYRFAEKKGSDANERLKLDDSILDKDLCEFILINALVASPLSPPHDLVLPKSTIHQLGMSHTVDDPLTQWFVQSSISADFEVMWANEKHGIILVNIPGWVRERILEVIFYGDTGNDIYGIAPLLSKCLKSLPVDLRRNLSKRILITGKLADIPNFKNRVVGDLASLLAADERWRNLANDIGLADAPVALSSEETNKNSTSLKGSDPHSDDFSLNPALEESSTKKIQTYSNSGILFPSASRAWIGASIATAAGIGGTEISSVNSYF
ncbi:hypothetical protein BB560_005371 [Smittium megazygosporum]|uniref:Actin-like ATPase domain-containing protein n=1 Tax=Smittium megazygosporum TaxID=133381 RepID=A0A2T9Z6N2_9FUNG|nr:hypothetical protein BB560_005371 [Smittium megazygosporum]